jgi:hypothetical protein
MLLKALSIGVGTAPEIIDHLDHFIEEPGINLAMNDMID